MQLKDGLLLFFLISASLLGFGQQHQTLPIFTVWGSVPERFLAGQKTTRVDSITLAQFRFQTLSELLQYTSPITFKQYGPGQLSTASFRGSSANHTAVLWNGININLPTLGLTDFSTLTVGSFDRVAIQYGAGASCVGSDAVGGSILLVDTPAWQQPGLSVLLGRQQASFQNSQMQAGVTYTDHLDSTWQVAGKSYIYYTTYKNDYPYRERGNYFVESSTTRQKGFKQDIYFQHRKNRRLSAHLWLTDNDLTVTPYDTIARERTRIQSYRFLATYESRALTLRAGWIRDYIDFARGKFTSPDYSSTDRFFSRVEHEFARRIGYWELILRSGSEWSHYRTKATGYGSYLIQENRADMYTLLRVQSRRWLFSANARQAFVTRFNPPFTPSLGAEYHLLHGKNNHFVTIKASIGRSYRVPTLNERYWKVLGNPTIQPENGFNLETGITSRWMLTRQLMVSNEITLFRNRIDEWSYWNPDLGYRVENLQLVVTRGLECRGSISYTSGNWQSGLTLNYALTRSTQERAYNQYTQDIVGRQLIYVPIHSGTGILYLAHGKNRLTIQTQASSRRYITFDNIQYLRGYLLINLLVETHFQLGPIRAQLQGQLNNIFDTLYLNTKRNAMPGRNLAISLICNLNTHI